MKLSVSPISTQAKNSAEIAIVTDAECDVLRFHKFLNTAHPDKESFIYLQKGNHIL